VYGHTQLTRMPSSLRDARQAVVRLIEDESLSGRVLVLVGGREPELLPIDA
jgi:hypothetical protein